MDISNDLSIYAQTRKQDALSVAYTAIYEYCVSHHLSSQKLETLQNLFYAECANTLTQLVHNLDRCAIANAVEIARNRFYCIDIAFSYVHRNRTTIGMCMNKMWANLRTLSSFKEVSSKFNTYFTKILTVRPVEAGCALLNWARIDNAIRIAPLSAMPDITPDQLHLLQAIAGNLPILTSMRKLWKGFYDISCIVTTFLDGNDLHHLFTSSGDQGTSHRPAKRHRIC